ncbi:hypothetical protein V3H44_22885 [Vibrio parahaemolyticus]|uniref:hypothetical protein n=1 Tax=Vibrio parahaemolyticus TaxID=670 RepID=UPI003B680F71
MNQLKKRSRKRITYALVVLIVPALFIGYLGALFYLTWPISEFSIEKSGVFGDSFGPLTALFSGLAFAGMIITILMQREELKLQREELSLTREELSKAAVAQQKQVDLMLKSAKINAAIAKYQTYGSFVSSNIIYSQDQVGFKPGDARRHLSMLEKNMQALCDEVEI